MHLQRYRALETSRKPLEHVRRRVTLVWPGGKLPYRARRAGAAPVPERRQVVCVGNAWVGCPASVQVLVHTHRDHAIR